MCVPGARAEIAFLQPAPGRVCRGNNNSVIGGVGNCGGGRGFESDRVFLNGVIALKRESAQSAPTKRSRLGRRLSGKGGKGGIKEPGGFGGMPGQPRSWGGWHLKKAFSAALPFRFFRVGSKTRTHTSRISLGRAKLRRPCISNMEPAAGFEPATCRLRLPRKLRQIACLARNTRRPF